MNAYSNKIVLEADYSSALTILLRYPASSHRPATFVQDALYLKNNPDAAGGNHIISKYSGKTPASQRRSGRSRFSSKLKGKDVHVHPPASSKPLVGPRGKSPVGSPTRYIRRQGIDVLLHDAAKAVYQRGEKWGVNKAVRDAVDEMKKNMQGLQLPSGSLSPREEKGKGNVRWSLDEGGYTPPTNDIEAAVEKLERRNRALAKMLEQALEELRDADGDAQKTSAEEFQAALKTIGFVKNRLENSSLSIVDGSSSTRTPVDGPAEAHSPSTPTTSAPQPSSTEPDSVPGTPQPKDTDTDTVSPSTPVSTTTTTNPARNPSTTNAEEDLSASTGENSLYLTPENRSSKPSLPNEKEATRPSLADSPFSWMLGSQDSKDWRAAGFFNTTASFATPATERKAGGKAPGFLFGDGDDGGTGRGGESKKGKGKGKGGGNGGGDRDGDGERGFDLASLRRG